MTIPSPRPRRAPSAAVLSLAMLLCALPALAQIAPISGGSPRLRPIPDSALSAAPATLRLGETVVDWRAQSPLSRAELIQVLASRRHTLTVAAWDGQGPISDLASLKLDATSVIVDDPTQARWWFSMRNEGKPARRARWQLARFPFADSVENWRAPTGLLAGGEIIARPNGQLPAQFDVDLGQYLLGGARTDSAQPMAVALTSLLHGEFPTGTMYLRVVGLGRNGSPVGLPSQSLRIDLRPLSEGRQAIEGSLPEVSIAGFQAYRPARADARCWVRPTRALTLEPPQSALENAPAPAGEGRLVAPTQPINLCESGNGEVLSLIADGFGTSEALADRLQQWSRERMEVATEAVRTETQRSYGGLTAACTSACRQAITLVLEQVVAVVGGPPAAVNTPSPLVDTGPYLTRLLADAFTHHSTLGEAFEAEAAAKAAGLFLQLMQGIGNAVPPAFEPLEERQARQPRLRLQLSAEVATSAGWLQLRELGRQPRLRPLLLPVPSLVPGQTLEVPLQLTAAEDPGVHQLQLPSQSELIRDASDAAQLLAQVSTHLAGMERALQRAQAPLRRGRYRIELAWRDAEGGYERIGVATCRAGRDDSCRLKR